MSIRSDARKVQQATGLSYQRCRQAIQKARSLKERKSIMNQLIAIHGKLVKIIPQVEWGKLDDNPSP